MKRYPGKFEGCADQRLGERLNQVIRDGWCDEEFGTVDCEGWHGLILRPKRRTSYVVHEDSQGFFDYEEALTSEIQGLWDRFRVGCEVVEEE